MWSCWHFRKRLSGDEGVLEHTKLEERKKRPSRYSDGRKTRQILYMTSYDTHNRRDVSKICSYQEIWYIYSLERNHIEVIYSESEGFRASCSSFSQPRLMDNFLQHVVWYYPLCCSHPLATWLFLRVWVRSKAKGTVKIPFGSLTALFYYLLI